MEERERIVRLWFEMWLRQKDLGIGDIFAEDVIYIESWGPKYEDRAAVEHWFHEWNSRSRVLVWDIKGFFHRGDRTVAEWYFKSESADGEIGEFDGMTLIEWTAEDRIGFLKEFGCNLGNYNPYENGGTPRFRDEKANWF